MKNVTMSKNVAIHDKELLKFVKKSKEILQTSLQQVLISDVRATSKFRPKK